MTNRLARPHRIGRHGGALLAYLIVGVVSMLTRLVLLLGAANSIDWRPGPIVATLTLGLFYDLVTASYLSIPIVLYLTLVPQRIFAMRWHRAWMTAAGFVLIYLLVFVGVVEWFFWKEFESRFNFIAVDYLVYTREVAGNIIESYPLGPLLGAIAGVTLLALVVLRRTKMFQAWLDSHTPWPRRLLHGAALLTLPAALLLVVDQRSAPLFANRLNQELSYNGVHSFVAAFRDNELDYDSFYPRSEPRAAFQRMRGLLAADNARFVSSDPADLTRAITNRGSDWRPNVIQITVESLSASFLGTFGNTEGLTPNLDRLSREGILFANCHATGTRTVRGMEALTLGLPPTPGMSIVKRPANANLFTLGSVFRSRGYDTVFLYGGYGYFDNMNRFFGDNGYRVVDRAARPASDTTFATIWGAADEDLYRWTLDEADQAYAAGKPFFHFVMTTSNHRPFDYPSGRVDIPAKSGRKGAVQYTDWAIGELLRQAARKPWFDDTIFVVVADHCAASGGRTDLPVERYEIPLIVYSPKRFAARQVDTLCSQIDYPPTLLGLLGWDYESRFYGRDLLQDPETPGRALVATYQTLGYLTGGRLAVLRPRLPGEVFAYDRASRDQALQPPDDALLQDAVAYYQTASYLFHHGLYAALEQREAQEQDLRITHLRR